MDVSEEQVLDAMGLPLQRRLERPRLQQGDAIHPWHEKFYTPTGPQRKLSWSQRRALHNI